MVEITWKQAIEEMSDEELLKVRAQLKALTFAERCSSHDTTAKTSWMVMFEKVDEELQKRRKFKVVQYEKDE